MVKKKTTDKKTNKTKSKKSGLTKKSEKKSSFDTSKLKKVKKQKEEKKIEAHARYIEQSAQKLRLVADLIRGKDVEKALEILNFTNKAAVRPIKKLLKSAVANAENNFEMNLENLKIYEVYVNEAPTYKRGRAGSRGRYEKILKRNSHISIKLTNK